MSFNILFYIKHFNNILCHIVTLCHTVKLLRCVTLTRSVLLFYTVSEYYTVLHWVALWHIVKLCHTVSHSVTLLQYVTREVRLTRNGFHGFIQVEQWYRLWKWIPELCRVKETWFNRAQGVSLASSGNTRRHDGKVHGWRAAAGRRLCTSVLSLPRGRPSGPILKLDRVTMFTCVTLCPNIAMWRTLPCCPAVSHFYTEIPSVEFFAGLQFYLCARKDKKKASNWSRYIFFMYKFFKCCARLTKLCRVAQPCYRDI